MDNIKKLQYFMESHVYAVWDFMCLLKSIRSLSTDPSPTIWSPPSISYESLRLINEIYIGEETDILPDGEYASHLEIYLRAMKEVGADTSKFYEFLKTKDINQIPEPAREFVQNTFELINSRKLHVIIAGFTHGRELIIPTMFTDIINELEIDAPMFKYYLERHIQIDSDEHGPAALKLLEESIGDDPQKRLEVEEAKIKALKAREVLWKKINV